jgi:hypothetical protein
MAHSGELAPELLLASARHFDVPVVEVAAQHPRVVQSPDAVLGILEGFDVPVTGSADVA